jgi:preprotein translocase subunit SecG
LFSKLTAVFAALFFTTSLLLAYMGTRTTAEPTSVIERAAQAAARARSAAPPPAQTPATQTPAVPQQPPAQPPPPVNK